MSILIALLIALTGFNAAADVRFITETENTAGYTYQKCDDGMLPADPCPYDRSLYANCCPDTYRYSAAECRAMGKGLGEYSCGGFYKCQ